MKFWTTMLKYLPKFFGWLTLFLIWGGNLVAQNSTNSPYSRFGLGDLKEDYFATVRSMGGIAAAFADPYYTNLSNPASLSRLQATSFEVGFDAFRTRLRADTTSANFWGGGLNYFSLAFPLFNPVNRLLDRKNYDFNWGMGLALVPYSSVSHFSLLTEEVDKVGMVSRESEGSGGLNQLLWSNGVNFKNLALGLSMGYLFGEIKDENAILYEEQRNAFGNYDLRVANYRGLLLKMGAQYQIDLSKGKGKENERDVKMITLGISSSASNRFRTFSTELSALKGNWGGLSDDLADEETDTLSYSSDIRRSGNLPGDLSFGVNYRRGSRWMIGLNLRLIRGENYENELSDFRMSNAAVWSLGFQHIPDATSYNSYFSRVLYRAGFSFGNDVREIEKEKIKRSEINVGIGLPVVVSRQLSFINLGLNYNALGGKIPIREGSFGFNLGVTLNNNLWFLKRKFD